MVDARDPHVATAVRRLCLDCVPDRIPLASLDGGSSLSKVRMVEIARKICVLFFGVDRLAVDCAALAALGFLCFVVLD